MQRAGQGRRFQGKGGRAGGQALQRQNDAARFLDAFGKILAGEDLAEYTSACTVLNTSRKFYNFFPRFFRTLHIFSPKILRNFGKILKIQRF